jgi:signal transduction histidine kinase
VHSNAHYNFDQLVSALQISKSRALQSGREETIVSLSQYNLPSLYFIFRTSEIHSSDVVKLKLVTLNDITASQRHQIQREQTLQFLSHDMRTPIAAILALKKRMLLPSNNLSQVQACANQITQNAQRLMDMMDGFIVHSQAEQMPLHLTGCLVSDLLDDAIEQAQPLADQHHIQLQLIEKPALLRIMVDTQLIVRALLNLLHNAIRHGLSGGAVIIRTSPHEGQLHPMARIEILNPMGTLNPQPDVKGFGLGLQFVKTTIQRHGGHFHLQIPCPNSDSPMAWIALDIPIHID